MSTEPLRCRLAGRDPGPYVLGALSPADRIEFERHAAGCTDCRAEIASLAALPGLLARLDRSAATALGDSAAAAAPSWESDQLLDTLLNRVKQQRATRRRQSWLRTGFAAALSAGVAAVLAIALLGDPSPTVPGRVAQPSASGSSSPSLVMVGMTRLSNSPITGRIAITPTSSGSTITMKCSYGESDYSDPWTLRLIAFGRDGSQEEVSSWTASPGDELIITGMTRFVLGDITHVDLQRADGTPVLRYRPV